MIGAGKMHNHRVESGYTECNPECKLNPHEVGSGYTPGARGLYDVAEVGNSEGDSEGELGEFRQPEFNQCGYDRLDRNGDRLDMDGDVDSRTGFFVDTDVYPSTSYLKRLKHSTDSDSCSSFCRVLWFLLFMLVLFAPTTALLVVLIPLSWMCKVIYSFCYKLWHVELMHCHPIEGLSHQEKLWLIDDEQNTHVSQTLIFVENGLDFYQIRNMIASRVIYAEHNNGERCYPRFTQRIVKLPISYGWIDDETFLLERHITQLPSTVTNVEMLQTYLSKMASSPIDFNHPLWQVQVLCGFGAEKETVILFRMHPSLVNGISLSRLFSDSFADQKAMPTTLWQFYSPYIYAINCFRAFFLVPIVFLQKWIFSSRDYNFIHSTTRISNYETNDLSLTWSDEFSLTAANRIKDVARASLNDILLSVTSSILRRHVQNYGSNHPKDCKILIPVDMNSHDIDINFGLRYSYVDFTLPTNTEGNIPRLWVTKHRVDNFKNSADAVVLRAISWISNQILPFPIWQKLHRFFYNKYTIILTNTPGPETEMFVNSKAVRRVMYWSPPFHSISLSISFFTYNNKLNMSVVGHKSVIPNPEHLTQDFIYEMSMLYKMLRNRRLPGEHSHRSLCPYRPFRTTENITVKQVEERLCEVQKNIIEVRESLKTTQKDSDEEISALNTMESLKCEFRQLLSELRKIRFAKKAVYPSDEEEEEVIISQEARRRSTRLSIASLYGTSGHSSAARSASQSDAEEGDRRESMCMGHDSTVDIVRLHDRPVKVTQRRGIGGKACAWGMIRQSSAARSASQSDAKEGDRRENMCMGHDSTGLCSEGSHRDSIVIHPDPPLETNI